MSTVTNQRMILNLLRTAGETDAAWHLARSLDHPTPWGTATSGIRLYQTTSWDVLLFRLLHQTLSKTRTSFLAMASVPTLVLSTTILLTSSRLFAYLIISSQRDMTTLVVRGRVTIGTLYTTEAIDAMTRDTIEALENTSGTDLSITSQTTMSTSTVAIGVCLLGTAPALRCLRLINYTFDESTPMGADVRCLIHYLDCTPTLRHLHLDGVRFACRADLVAVATAVAHSPTLMTTRWTDVCGADGTIDPVAMSTLLNGRAGGLYLDHMGGVWDMGRPTGGIQRLSIRRMVVSSAGLDAVGTMRLVSLSIHTCAFRLVESTAFLAWIASPECTIRNLGLQNNGLSGNHLFCSLSSALGKNLSIRTMDLSDNFMTRLSFHLIVYALPLTLTTLTARRNMIRIALDDLTHIMARIELRKPHLSTVDMTGNYFFRSSSGHCAHTRIRLVTGQGPGEQSTPLRTS
jgi:hypothetical protein